MFGINRGTLASSMKYLGSNEILSGGKRLSVAFSHYTNSATMMAKNLNNNWGGRFAYNSQNQFIFQNTRGNRAMRSALGMGKAWAGVGRSMPIGMRAARYGSVAGIAGAGYYANSRRNRY